MFICSLSANPADHVNGYGLRLPDSQVGGHNATLLDIGKNHYGPVDGGHAVQGVAIRILMSLQARIAYYGEVGGKPPLPVRQF